MRKASVLGFVKYWTDLDADEPMEDAPSNPIDSGPDTPQDTTDHSQATTEPTETVTVTNGRRRGRRRIMKKKTVKDEEGYLGASHLQALQANC